jgi:hypothetical protein
VFPIGVQCSVLRAQRNNLTLLGLIGATSVAPFFFLNSLYNEFIPDSRKVRLTLATTGDSHGLIDFFRTRSF